MIKTSESPIEEDLEPLLDDAAEMGIAQDGSIDSGHCHSDTEMSSFGAPLTLQTTHEEEGASVVYVSIMDPVGEAAFKPSKTKPLPKWMHLLPSNVHRERRRRAKADAQINQNSCEIEQVLDRSRGVSRDRARDTDPSDSEERKRLNGRQQRGPARIDLPPAFNTATKTRAKISFDQMPKADIFSGDRESKTSRRSHTVESKYMTAPQSAADSQRSRSPTSFPKTPHPSVSRPALQRNDTSSYFSHRASTDTQEEGIDDSSCVLVSAQLDSAESSQSGSSVSTNDSNMYFPLPSQSSEYIERYQPKPTPAAKFEKYIAGEPERVLDKIKRQRAEEFLDNADDEGNGKKARYVYEDKGKALGLLDREGGLDPQKQNLHQELKSLFRED